MIYKGLNHYKGFYFGWGLFRDICKRVASYSDPQHIKRMFSTGKLKKV